MDRWDSLKIIRNILPMFSLLPVFWNSMMIPESFFVHLTGCSWPFSIWQLMFSLEQVVITIWLHIWKHILLCFSGIPLIWMWHLLGSFCSISCIFVFLMYFSRTLPHLCLPTLPLTFKIFLLSYFFTPRALYCSQTCVWTNGIPCLLHASNTSLV